MKSCPTCLSPLADGFRFCPKCGSAIPTDPLPAPTGGLTIEFAASTSPGFQFALQEAVRQPGFERLGTDKKPVFRVTFSKGHSGDAMRLVELVKPWRNKAVYVDGEPLPWEQVFSFVSCFARRQAAYRPGSYCFMNGTSGAASRAACFGATGPSGSVGAASSTRQGRSSSTRRASSTSSPATFSPIVSARR